MKFFTLRSTTEEQKTSNAILFRLYTVFLVFSVGILGTFAIYLQIMGEKRSTYSQWQFMFFLMIIIHVISMAPNIIKYSWKQIIIISSLTGVILGIFFGLTLRLI
jgi:hypothetical protein